MYTSARFEKYLQSQSTAHCARLVDLLFLNSDGSTRTPKWLSAAVSRLERHYRTVGHASPEFASALQGFKRREDEPFELWIVGEGKFGKSTLLNALMGDTLSRVHRHPATRCFIRFIPSRKPRPEARVFARVNKLTSEVLRQKLGLGKRVPDLFEITEHVVPAEVGDRLLEWEVEIGSEVGVKSEPTIYEYEREVEISSRCALPPALRIVDTQGLNQMFPEDLVEAGNQADAGTTKERFDHWLATTPRGKHIEWQFRRCDAVLWVVSAIDSSSAVSRCAMEYFEKYGKKTILVVTKLDCVENGETGREKVLRKIDEQYGAHAFAVCHVNGFLALRSVMAGDADGIKRSGLADLARTINTELVEKASRVRATSVYVSALATERQFRAVLEIFRQTLEQCVEQLEGDRRRVLLEKKNSLGEASKAVSEAQGRIKAEFDAAAYGIDLKDNGESALRKLGAEARGNSLRGDANNILTGVAGKVQELADWLRGHPYRFPRFDADGKVAGEAFAVEPNIVIPHVQCDSVWFRVTLVRVGPIGRFWYWVTKQRESKIRERQRDVLDEFLPQWSSFTDALQRELLSEVSRCFDALTESLDDIVGRIRAWEGRDPRATLEVLRMVLEEMAVKPVPVGPLIDLFRRNKQILGGQRVPARGRGDLRLGESRG